MTFRTAIVGEEVIGPGGPGRSASSGGVVPGSPGKPDTDETPIETMIPTWLTTLSWVSLAVGALCAARMAWVLYRRPAHMGVMNVVWPVCALFGGPLILWFFARHGRSHGGGGDDDGPPFVVSVAKGTLHCGAGCTLGDIAAEFLAVGVPAVLVPLGYPGLFDEKIFAVWILDYGFAFAIGIAFQYFAIAPMRGLGLRQGLRAALKADAASLTSWQVGMYGLMGVAHFWLFKQVLGVSVGALDPAFWFTMQIAMIAGFLTALPVNWWLIRSGIKERM